MKKKNRQKNMFKTVFTWKKSAAFLKPICLELIMSMACSKASSSVSLLRSIEMRWYSRPAFVVEPRVDNNG